MPEGVITLIIVLAILGYLYISKAKRFDTMLRIAELGESVDEKLLATLEKSQGSYKNDYKSSLLWIAAGIPAAIAISGSTTGSEKVLGLIPVLIGVAYFISGRLRLRGPDQ